MEIRNFKSELLTKWQVVNESGNTRNGFYHKSTLLWNGMEQYTEKVNYLNRTWECYTFQTSMNAVVRKAMESRKNIIIDSYKFNNNISRITKKHKEILEKIIASDDIMAEYDAMREELKSAT